MEVKSKYILKMVITQYGHMTTYLSIARPLPSKLASNVPAAYLKMIVASGHQRI